MSASTYGGAAVQLLEFGDVAPFPVLQVPRQRSSSLTGPLDLEQLSRQRRHTQEGSVLYPIDGRNVEVGLGLGLQAYVEDIMAPGRFNKILAGSREEKWLRGGGSGIIELVKPSTHIVGGKQKITKAGRERRLSLGARSARTPGASPQLGSTTTSPRVFGAGQAVGERAEEGEESPWLVIQAHALDRSLVEEGEPGTDIDGDVVMGETTDADLDRQATAVSPGSPAEEKNGISRMEIQRAAALAALNGETPPLPVAASPRRRTTSSSDAPTLSQHVSQSKTQRRSRVQSASAAFANADPTASPTPARRRRRSLSAENSLVAARLARDYMTRELGEEAMARRTPDAPAIGQSAWKGNYAEQKELWLALRDGVLLCR